MKVFDGVTKLGYYTFKYGYEFISIPIMARYSIGNYNRFYTNTGPYMGYLLNYTERFDDNRIKVFRTDDMNKIDIGISFGFGFSSPIDKDGRLNFNIEYRNNVGLRNLVNDETYGIYK
jgi:hypothetical protein